MGAELLTGTLLLAVLWCLRVALEKVVLCGSECCCVIQRDRLEMVPHNHLELDGFDSVKDRMNVCIKEKQ